MNTPFLRASALVASLLVTGTVHSDDATTPDLSQSDQAGQVVEVLQQILSNGQDASDSEDETTSTDDGDTAETQSAVADLPVVGYVPEDKLPKTRGNRRILSPTDATFRRALALQHTEPQSATQMLEHVLKSQPGHVDARLMLGRLLTMSRRAEQARVVLLPLLNTDNFDWRPWFWAGSAMLQIGELRRAEWMLDQALARNRDVPAIWIQRAIVEQEKGSGESALQLLNEALRLAPDDPHVLLNIAVSANTVEGLGSFSEAYYAKYTKVKRQSALQGD
ncbi:MAG: tetratricopeptide repeat protein [Pseudomonadota bacterium]